MVHKREVKVGEACREVRYIRIGQAMSNGGCDATISKLSKGLHISGVEGARADDMSRLDMTRTIYHSYTLMNSNLMYQPTTHDSTFSQAQKEVYLFVDCVIIVREMVSLLSSHPRCRKSPNMYTALGALAHAHLKKRIVNSCSHGMYSQNAL